MRAFLLACFLIVPFLAGCSSDLGWPDQGHGGIAELRPAPLAGEADQMNATLSCLRGRINQFKQSEAAGLSTASLPRAELMSNRIARELAGDLIADARADLRTLEILVADLLSFAGIDPDATGVKGTSCAVL